MLLSDSLTLLRLIAIQRDVHDSLADDIDTPAVILHLRRLVDATNLYLQVT